MFSPHFEGPGPSPFTPKLASGTHCAAGVLLFTLVAPLLAPKWDPRVPRGSPKGPKGVPKPPPGRPKTVQKSTWDPTWVSKGVREASGVAPGGKMTPKLIEKRRFLNIFGETIGGTVPKKLRAFRLVF